MILQLFVVLLKNKLYVFIHVYKIATICGTRTGKCNQLNVTNQRINLGANSKLLCPK